MVLGTPCESAGEYILLPVFGVGLVLDLFLFPLDLLDCVTSVLPSDHQDRSRPPRATPRFSGLPGFSPPDRRDLPVEQQVGLAFSWVVLYIPRSPVPLYFDRLNVSGQSWTRGR